MPLAPPLLELEDTVQRILAQMDFQHLSQHANACRSCDYCTAREGIFLTPPHGDVLPRALSRLPFKSGRQLTPSYFYFLR